MTTITTVGTSVSRVIKDNLIPNTFKTATIAAVLKNESIPEQIVNDLIESIGVKAERYYDYAKENYEYGLPSGEFLSPVTGRAELQSFLENKHGSDVVIEYSYVCAPNLLHLGWEGLITQYDFDLITGIPGNQPTRNNSVSDSDKEIRTLYDMCVVVPKDELDKFPEDSLEFWGKSPQQYRNGNGVDTSLIYGYLPFTPIVAKEGITEAYVEVTFTWMPYVLGGSSTEAVPAEQLFSNHRVDLGAFDLGATYLHARYTANGVTHFLTYRIGTSEYPALDTIQSTEASVVGEYFPFLYFRFNKQSADTDENSDIYRQSKKMASLLGMDYASVVESINENPDIADVEQAMLVFGVDPLSKEQVAIKYLYEFHDMLYATAPTRTFNDGYQGEMYWNDNSKFHTTDSFVIQDKRFKMTFGNAAIIKKRISGSIGPVGTYNSSYSLKTFNYQYWFVETNWELSDTGKMPPVLTVSKRLYKSHIYRKQISDSFYDEVEVLNMTLRYIIHGEYLTTSGDDKGENDILLVPLDMSLLDKFSLGEKERLYSLSLHYVFNSRVLTKLKWYQEDWFQIVMIIVAVVITVLSWGTAGPAALAALAAGTVTLQAFLISAIIALGKMLIVQVALKLFVKIVGTEFAFLAAMVGVIAGMAGNLGFISMPGLPFASDLLMLSTGLANTVGSVVSVDMDKLRQDMASFDEHTKEMDKLLKAGERLLDNTVALSPMIIFGETPEQYYSRTVHSGNLGALAISGISYNASNLLALPSVSDSLGEYFNESSSQWA